MHDLIDGLPLIDPGDGFPLQDPVDGLPFVDAKHKCTTTGLIDPVGFHVGQAGFTGAWTLEVWGLKPCPNMQVCLQPMIYVIRPEYWRIEIMGILSTDLKDRGKDFHERFDLTNMLGNKGVELVGATMNENVDVPPGASWGNMGFKIPAGGNSSTVG